MDRHEFTADIAELVLSIARRIATSVQTAPDVVRLSNLESLVMRFIDRNPGVSPSQLGEHLGLRTANVSAILRQLEEKRLVRRESASDDRRAVTVHATALASHNLARLREEWSKQLDGVIPVDVDEQALLGFLRDFDAGFFKERGH